MATNTKPKNFFEDTFEKAFEIPKNIAKGAVDGIVETATLGAIKPKTEKAPKNPQQKAMQEQMEKAQQEKPHTPLNFEDLGKKYQDKDQQKLAEQRQQFQRVLNEQEKARQEIEQEREQTKREEEEQKYLEHQQQQAAMNQGPTEVAGKAKGRIGQPLSRKATVDPYENRASKGK